MKTQKIKRIIAFAFLALILGACAGPETPSGSQQDLGSRVIPPPVDGTGGGNKTEQDLVSVCSGIDNGQTGLVAALGYFQLFGYPVDAFDSYKRLIIKTLPPAILSADDQYLQFFRWQETIVGQKSYNNSAVLLKFQHRNQLPADPSQVIGYLITDNQNGKNEFSTNVISRVAMQRIIDLNNLSINGVTINNFFEHIIVVAEGLDFQFTALSALLYDQSQGNVALAVDDILIPAFISNPLKYETSKATGSLLPALHPAAPYKNQGYSDQDFQAISSARFNHCMHPWL